MLWLTHAHTPNTHTFTQEHVHTNTHTQGEGGALSGLEVSGQDQGDDPKVLAGTPLPSPMGQPGLGISIPPPAEVALVQASTCLTPLDPELPRSSWASDLPLSPRLRSRTEGPRSHPNLIHGGVILTDSGVGDVVSGDCLHVFSGCAQVVAASGEPPRPTVYLRGHGEAAGWELSS